MIDLELDTKKLDAMLNKVGRQLPADIKKSLCATAQYGIYNILDRTERGVGYRGIFQPYSNSYAGFRSKKGRQTSVVDFNFSGRMLSSIKSKCMLNEATISFNRATEAKKAAMLNKTRPWFGFNQTEKNKLSHFFYKRLMK